jgi:rhamnogalacturonan acetylesterase
MKPFAFFVVCCALMLPTSVFAADEPVARPTLFIIGDSTVKNGTKGQQGWGEVIGELFDTNRIVIANHAIGGRSSRTFLTEGRWDKVLEQLKPSDFVLMQFGHNDGGKPDDPQRPRGSLAGTGEQTIKITNPTNKRLELVHSYGWYMRKYVSDAKAKGATPIVCSLIPRNIWKDGKVARAANSYGKWAREIAESEHVPLVDLNELIAARYESLGEEKVKPLFFGDHTHTSPEGAKLNASIVAEGLKQLPDCAVRKFLK